MHTDAGKVGENANRRSGFPTAFEMDGIVGQPTRAAHRRPRPPTGLTDACLVAVQDWRWTQRRQDLRFEVSPFWWMVND